MQMFPNQIRPSRLIYQQSALPEKPAGENRELYDGVSKTIETSYRGQILLANQLNEKFAPIAKEKAAFDRLLNEMKEELAKNNYSAPVERDLSVFGQTVHVVMDKNGTNQEYVDGQEVNFMQWASSRLENNQQGRR